MSHRAVLLANGLQGLPPGPRAVLGVLAKYAGQDGGGAFPSVYTMATATLISERSVQRHLRWLEARKLIAVEREASQWRPTTWALVFCRAVNLSPLSAGFSAPRGDSRGDSRGDILAPDNSHDQNEQITPQPPARAGGAAPVLKRELRAATKYRERLARAYGRSCLHEPRCETEDDCLLLIVDGLRARHQEALGRRDDRLRRTG